MISTCKNCCSEYKYNPSQGYGYYCSNKCQSEYEYKKNISDWLSKKITGKKSDDRPSKFVRKYMLEECNYKCSMCGWGEPNPVNGNVYLEIDHINGDRINNYKENLQVLCPNCHSLTPTYKNLNRNPGFHKDRLMGKHKRQAEERKILTEQKRKKVINDRIIYLNQVNLDEYGILSKISKDWNISVNGVKKFLKTHYFQLLT